MKIAINTRLVIAGKMAGEATYIYSLLRQFARLDTENEYHLLFDRPIDKSLFKQYDGLLEKHFKD